MPELGLIIDDATLQFVCESQQVPVAFGADEDVESSWEPPLIVESQGSTNSCVGHSIALAASHANYVATSEVLRFSRRFGYITSQMESGQYLGADQGTSIQSSLQAATKYGCCLEATCPFQERYSTQLPKEAYEEAAKHKHQGETRYDCRDWNTAINWITDKRCIVIGTQWYSGQGSCSGIEDKRCGTSGSFRGYHARLLTSWSTHGGMIVPRVQNSHGKSWGSNGTALVLRDLWDFWQKDPNFFALGFSRINEVEPKRRSYKESTPGDAC